MVMRITGLTRSLLNLAKPREKEQDQRGPREGLPELEDLGAVVTLMGDDYLRTRVWASW